MFFFFFKGNTQGTIFKYLFLSERQPKPVKMFPLLLQKEHLQSRLIFTLNLPSVTVSLTGNHRNMKTSILLITIYSKVQSYTFTYVTSYHSRNQQGAAHTLPELNKLQGWDQMHNVEPARRFP